MSETTRRGFFGLVAGAAAASRVPAVQAKDTTIAGFFDVNRVHPNDRDRLMAAGWVPVNGDPKRAAAVVNKEGANV